MNINLKKVISSVAALAMSLSCFTAFAADFTDVEATATYKTAIDELVALEIVNGYEDGSFKPENEITRAEVTKMVVAAMGPDYTAAAESSKGASGFADVDAANHWASGFISVGVTQKFINGMGDGTFAPDTNVTYAQIVKMLVAALGYDRDAQANGGYPNGYLQQGSRLGVTDGISGVGADTAVTRAIVAQLISNSLDIPLQTIVRWDTNYVTNEPIAVMDIMDGSGTGTSKKAYKTLLTEFHDAYVVRGRVTGTFATGASDIGMVDFQVEYADNYKKEVYNAKKDAKSKITEEVYVGETNAEELLHTYSEALIQIDEHDDATILAITPYGKNEIVEVPAKLFSGATYDKSYKIAEATYDSGLHELVFFKNENTTKKDTYEVDQNVKLYVNGVLVKEGAPSIDAQQDGDDTGSTVDKYVECSLIERYIGGYVDGTTVVAPKNQIGVVTLINSPDEGAGSSLDKDIDVIMVTYPKWAVVGETFVSGDNSKIVFDKVEDGVDAVLSIDATDEEFECIIYKNGEEATFEDIKADDVALLTYDISPVSATNPSDSSLDDAKRVIIELCDTVVEGMVTGKSDDKYTVNGEEYELLTGTLEVGYEYALRLDAAGRVIDKEELASAKNYGIIDRVYKNTDQELIARLIKADGTRENIVIKSAITLDTTANKNAVDLYNKTYAANLSESDGVAGITVNDIGATTATLKDVQYRLVSYKINSQGELSNISFLTAGKLINKAYDADSNAFGNIDISDSTAVIDARKANTKGMTLASNYGAADFAAASVDFFVDGEDYTVLYADPDSKDNYKFVVVLAGNNAIGVRTGFAVVDSCDKMIDEADGETKTALTVLDASGMGDLVTYFVAEDKESTVGDPARGTVVALGIVDGVITEYEPLFTNFATSAPISLTTAKSIFDGTKASNPTGAELYENFFLESFSAWDDKTNSDPNGWARTGFGVILDRNESKVTIGNMADAVDEDQTTVKVDLNDPATPDDDTDDTTCTKDVHIDVVGTASSSATPLNSTHITDVRDFKLDADVNVYVIDIDNAYDKKNSGWLSMGVASSIMKTPGVKEISAYKRTATTIADGVSYTDTTYGYEDVKAWDKSNVDQFNYAYFKMVDDRITDIVVFVAN